MTINQSGTKLTGHATDEFGEYEINGRVIDDQVPCVWSVAEDGKMLEITMKGKLETATLITGTAKLGDVGEGPLSARRTGDAGDRLTTPVHFFQEPSHDPLEIHAAGAVAAHRVARSSRRPTSPATGT